MFLNSIRGFFMALADSIPGISGGTIAYLLGFYDLFIESLNNLFKGEKLKRLNSAKFLAQLGSGWIIGMILSILILTSLFTSYIYFMSSLLIGLTLFSIPAIYKEEKAIFEKKAKSIIKYLFFFFFGSLIVILITVYSPTTSSTNATSLLKIDFKMALYLFIAGNIAISTMMLPGISGSSLLMIMGLYLPIINALKELMHLNIQVLPSIICFGIGILSGAFSTVSIVKYSLEKHRSSTISFILGLVVAATYAISQGPKTLEIPQPPLSLNSFSIIAFLIGGTPILLISYFKKRKEKRIH